MEEDKIYEHPIKLTIEIPDTICKGEKDILIFLKIENLTSEELTITNPSRWGNIYPIIKEKGKIIPIIKVNPFEPFKDIIKIKENEILRIKFDYTLDKLFNIDHYPSGKYELYFEYFYEPRIEKGFVNKGKKRQNVEDKCIISDVFTFFVQ